MQKKSCLIPALLATGSLLGGGGIGNAQQKAGSPKSPPLFVGHDSDRDGHDQSRDPQRGYRHSGPNYPDYRPYRYQSGFFGIGYPALRHAAAVGGLRPLDLQAVRLPAAGGFH
jgi:hypothetical protein